MFIKRTSIGLIMTALCAAFVTAPAPAQSAAELDQALQYLSTYEFGQDRTPLNAVEKTLRAASGDAAAIEQLSTRLAGLLATAPVDAKRWICRELAVMGTASAVPALIPLLANAETSDIGCRVLESMSAPEAGAALREAIPGLPDDIKLGAIGALGRRHEPASVPVLAALLAHANAAVADAAAAALGDIGDETASQALESAAQSAPASLKMALADARLTCAACCTQAGKTEQAAAIYEKLFAAGEAGHVRAAALNGLINVQPARAIERVLAAMKDADPILAAAAAGLIRDNAALPGPEATQQFAALLRDATPANKLLLLDALAHRGDMLASPAVLKTAADGDESVRLAAYKALGFLGDASAVELLLESAATGKGELRRVARASLNTLPGSDVNAALIKQAKSAKQELQLEAITALGERRAFEAKDLLLALAEVKEEAVCFEALSALQIVAMDTDQSALLALLDKAGEESRRAKIEKTIIAVAQRIPEEAKRADAAVHAFDAAQKPGVKASIIRILGGIANAPAYEKVKAALDDAPDIRLAAVTALAEWPNAAPLADLEQLARTATPEQESVKAFEGYVRMLKTAGLPPQEALKHYQNALGLAKNAAAKKMILGGLSDVTLGAALDMAIQLQNDAELAAEANLAALKLAQSLCGAYPGKAKAVADPFLAGQNENMKKMAQGIVNTIGGFEDYLTAWSVSGPYFENGKNAEMLFDIPFAPEQAGAAVNDWRIVPMGLIHDKPWAIGLDAFIGGFERVVYLGTVVQLPKEQDAILELGSNDGVKVWIDGTLVHGRNTGRPLTPGEDKVAVHLKPTSTMLMAVYNKGGEWGACARFRTPEGGPVEGLNATPFAE